MAGIEFSTLAGSSINEQFKMALAQVARNIVDPNMDPEAARGITINIKLVPKATGVVNITGDVKVKLAGMAKTESVFLVGQDARTGRIEMSEYGNNQPQVSALQADPPPAAYTNVRPADEDHRGYDPSTGEIYDATSHNGPIDLRAQH